MIGKPLVLTLTRKEGTQEHKIAGYVVEAESSTPRAGEHEIGPRVVARPRLHRLTQRADCRVFQNLAAPDIVKKVLDGAGVPAEAQSWKLQGSYPAREYTTQYRETDFDFIRRLLSEEGIAFAIDSSSGADVVTFFDGDLGAIEGSASIPHRPTDGLNGAHDAIGAVTHQKSTAPGKVNLRDYDFKRPRLDLNAKVEADDESEKSLEVYHYPGRFTEPADGDRYAKAPTCRSRCSSTASTTCCAAGELP